MWVGRRPAVIGLLLGVTVGQAWVAQGQPLDVVGTRAAGMAGAFVAVADDPSATYWNPAGLADGRFFGLSVDFAALERPRADDGRFQAEPAERRAWLVAMTTPPLGLSYLRRHDAGRDRRSPAPPRPGDMALARLDTQHFGVTLLQSLADGIAVGGTLKYVRGTAAAGVATVATSEDARERASDLPDASEAGVDLDLGLHVVRGAVRLGVVARSLFEPSFTAPSGRELVLGRQVRVGAAVSLTPQWTLAADADLLEADTLDGPTRQASAGTEHWWMDRRFGLRGGLRAHTTGKARPVGTFGASVALRPGLYAEGHGSVGQPEAEQAWSLSLRFAF